MPTDTKFLMPLMCFIDERGGATCMTTATIQRLWDKLKDVPAASIGVGFQPVPDGIMLVNLIGGEAFTAWDDGTINKPKEEEDVKESKDSNREE